MTRIKGYGFTRKDKVFAEFETDSGKYLFKESHNSKNSYYDVGIYNPEGKKIYKIQMDREQINRIKNSRGIADIDFATEEGFRNYIRNQYDKDFDEDKFRSFFTDHFVREYEDMSDRDYLYNISQEGKSIEVRGTTEEYYTKYVAYLVSKAPNFVLENIYYDNPQHFRKIFKYRDDELAKQYIYSPERMYGTKYLFLEGAKAQILQALNARNIDYMSYEEFVASGEYANFEAQPRKKL